MAVNICWVEGSDLSAVLSPAVGSGGCMASFLSSSIVGTAIFSVLSPDFMPARLKCIQVNIARIHSCGIKYPSFSWDGLEKSKPCTFYIMLVVKNRECEISDIVQGDTMILKLKR